MKNNPHFTKSETSMLATCIRVFLGKQFTYYLRGPIATTATTVSSTPPTQAAFMVSYRITRCMRICATGIYGTWTAHLQTNMGYMVWEERTKHHDIHISVRFYVAINNVVNVCCYFLLPATGDSVHVCSVQVWVCLLAAGLLVGYTHSYFCNCFQPGEGLSVAMSACG